MSPDAGIAGPDSTASSVAPPPPTAPNTGGGLGKAAQSAELGLPQTLSDITKREAAGVGSLEADAAKLQMNPPQFKPDPPPSAQAPDPIRAWGSAAMIMAGLASMFTRTPLTTAMNAAAGVVNAYHDGDQQKANYAFETWKVADENYKAAFSYQMDYYKAVLGDVAHREELIMKMGEEEKRDAQASVTAVATAFNDQVMMQQRGFEDQLQLLNYRDIHQERYTKASEDAIKLDEMRRLSADPNFQKLPPAEQMQIMLGHMAGTEAGDQKREQMVLKLQENTQEGKAYSQAETAWGDMQSAVADPKVNIYNNPQAQIGLIDRFIFLETGSVRPALAQYQKVLGATTAQDVMDMVAGRIQYHPVLGRDQIHNLVTTAEAEYKQRKRNYTQMLLRPANRTLASGLQLLPPDKDINLLQSQPTPQNIKYFDQTYGTQFGPTIAEDILGER